MPLARWLLPILAACLTATAAHAVVTPIGDLHYNFGNGIPLLNGQVVTVQGTITVPTGIYSPTNVDVHLQDSTGAITLFVSGGVASLPLALGDSVEVTGYMKHFNGLAEIDSSLALVTVTHLGPASVAPQPLVLTCQQLTNSYLAGDHEPNESRLVRINGATVISGTWPATVSGSNTTLTIQDATGTAVVFIDRDSPVNGSPTPAPGFDLIGVLRQFDSSNPYTTGYQLVPRFAADAVPGATPCVNFTAGPDVSAIDSLGATISWTTDVASTSFVRYGIAGGAYTDSTGSAAAVTSHSVTLTGLNPRTLYRFQAKSDACYTGARHLVTFPSPDTPGDIDVFFTKSVDHGVSGGLDAAGDVDMAARLIERIDAATTSLDCALYWFDIPAITDALIAARARGVLVRLITDAGGPTTEPLRLTTAGIPNIPSTFGGNHAQGIMHNKYVVIDAKSPDKDAARVWTGSWNLFPESQDEANNSIVLRDYGLAAAYTLDFDQMWGDSSSTPNAANSRMGNRKVEVIPHQFRIGGLNVEAYMSPSDQPETRMIQYIQQAQHTQLFCIFDFTSDPLSLAMRAHRDSTPDFFVRGCFDGPQVGAFSEWCRLDGQVACGNEWSPRADVFQADPPNYTLLHHKYQILDVGHPEALVWTGSHNWSAAAKTNNDENTVVIHDLVIANLYYQEWHQRYTEAGGGPLAVDGPRPGARLSLAVRPNPSSGPATVEFAATEPGVRARLAIYDIAGRQVRVLIEGRVTAGAHQAQWDGRDAAGVAQRAGVYFYRLELGRESATKRTVLAR